MKDIIIALVILITLTAMLSACVISTALEVLNREEETSDPN
jgi:hypothetical protein